MAKNLNNMLTRNYGGKFSDEFVFRNLKDDTFLTKYPDRSNVRLSLRQRDSNSLFKQAVAYAQSVLADPVLTAEMKKQLKSRKKTYNQSVYHGCIQQFMVKNSLPSRVQQSEELMERYRAAFDLAERQFLALEMLALEQELSNITYKNLNKVSKATATRDLQDLVSRGILSVSGRGAGVKYTLLPLNPEKG
jgi:predicted HTH transcriptional regulator